MKIFLIGMPGSGKTTLGKQLAEHLQIEFVDLDNEIEKLAGRSISEIFSHQGEDHFRIIEAQLLRDWAAATHSFVMSTGGGAPCFHEGMEIINEHGLSIFLNCSVAELIDRVKRNQERPLLLTSDENELREKLERMLAARIVCYNKAKIIVEHPSLDALLKSLRTRM